MMKSNGESMEILVAVVNGALAARTTPISEVVTWVLVAPFPTVETGCRCHLHLEFLILSSLNDSM